jgi:hypothetical protein
MRTLRILALAVLLALVGGACFGKHGVGSALRSVAANGVAELRAAGAANWEPLADGRRVAPGADVRTGDSSSVALERDDGARIELGPRTEVHVDGVTRLTLASGRLLTSINENSIAIVNGNLIAAAEKALFRVDSIFGVRVGSYGGTVAVTEDASVVTVGDLTQIEVTGGVFRTRDAVPLRISATDPWDRQVLADAIELDRQLRVYDRRFKADFGRRVTDPSTFLAFAPGLPLAAVVTSLQATGDPSDVLFGVLAARRLGGAQHTLADVIRLRAAGATWGVIARLKGIATKDFLQLVISALLPQASPSPGATGTGGLGGGGGGPGGGGGGGGPTSKPTTKPTTSPTPTHSPSPSPSPSPTCSAVDQLLGRCTGVTPLSVRVGGIRIQL